MSAEKPFFVKREGVGRTARYLVWNRITNARAPGTPDYTQFEDAFKAVRTRNTAAK